MECSTDELPDTRTPNENPALTLLVVDWPQVWMLLVLRTTGPEWLTPRHSYVTLVGTSMIWTTTHEAVTDLIVALHFGPKTAWFKMATFSWQV